MKCKKMLCRLVLLLLCAVLCIGMSGCKEASFVGPDWKYEGTEDDIIISAFWPPMEGFVNDEQFGYLRDAAVDLLEWIPDPIYNGEQTMKDMLRLTKKYGIYVTIADQDFQDLDTKTDDQIRELVRRYRDEPSVAGYFIIDEPLNANIYGRVARIMREEDPDCIPQLNLFPFGTAKDYRGYAEDWLGSAGPGAVRYLSFDAYPFGAAPGSDPEMFANLNEIREIGLRYGVDTALYIQATGMEGSYRRLNAAESRYHTSAALAYGFKNLKYFTWMTPVGRSETFLDSIILPNGEKSDVYDGIAENNKAIKAAGKILGRLDAIEIYHGGPKRNVATQSIPKDWYLKSSGDENYIVSVMVDRHDGRNYLMLVNKDFKNDRTITFQLDGITELKDVTAGAENAAAVSIQDGAFSADFKAGGFRLFEVADGTNLVSEPKKRANANLAQDCAVYSVSSPGRNDMYNYKVVDGKKSSVTGSYGCQLSVKEGEDCWLLLDFGKNKEFNRIDLYPAGKDDKYGTYFPKSYTISVSEDGENFVDIIQETGAELDLSKIPSYAFAAVHGRYVKITIQDAPVLNGDMMAELAEVMVYFDDGSIPAAVS